VIVRNLKYIKKNKMFVKCPNGGFISNRFLLKSDNMGFTITKTIIPVNGKQHWHYKNHLEACYCIKGKGIITDLKTNKHYKIIKDTLYALNNNDNHLFEALEEVVLICVFNPALKGKEIHDKNGTYKT
jgi:L-ectoine synthase